MQVTETSTEGLKREYSVVIAAEDMARRLDGKLQKISLNISMPGFRPGKVPTSLVKKIHGDSVMGEVLDEAVRETTAQIIQDKELRPAVQPKIEVKDFVQGSDLTYEIALEVLPDIELPDFSKIKMERLVADIPEEKIQDVIGNLASQQTSFEDRGEGANAEDGDAVTIDFEGSIDGQMFEGGAAKGHQLLLGANTFIPGFEDQLLGTSVGDSREVKVTFPENYQATELAGKEAVFKVDVSAVKKPLPVEINDDLAKKMGMENLDALTKAVREQAVREHDNVSRVRLKRSLLDILADTMKFEVPAAMIEMEFEQVWSQVEQDMANQGVDTSGIDPADDGALDDMKTEYREISDRRVRLGLLLAEVGRINNLEIMKEELSQALSQEARRYPGQEREVYEHFQKHPEAMAQLQAPLLEEKAVDFIIELADVSENKITHEELMRPPGEDEDEKAVLESFEKKGKKSKSDGDGKGKAKVKAKKPASKKPVAKKSEGKKPAAKKPAAKKPAAKKSTAKKTAGKKAPAKSTKKTVKKT